MNTDWFDDLKAACCMIETADGTGSGYLAGEGQVITCEHVVRNIKEGEGGIKLSFGQGDAAGTLVEKDVETDSALIKLDVAPAGVAPLRFARLCVRQAVWDGYGFPALAGGVAIPLQGVVMDPKGLDKKRRPALALFSHQITTNAGMHGFSGSPVLVNGYVVGHLKRIIGEEEDNSKPAYGYVFASPSDGILKLLNINPFVESVEDEGTRPLCIPAIPEDSFHAYISSNSANRAFAKRVFSELAAKGFRIAADWTDPPGALANSSKAVVVLSREYLASALSRSEAEKILARKMGVIPVLVDDAKIPVEWSAFLSYDFRGMSKPEGPMLEQLLYAVAGQRPPVRSVAAMATTSSAADPEKAQALINAGLPELALKYVPASDNALRVRQVRALALAKNKQIDEAVQLLEQLKAEGYLDGETAGLLAGRYRQRWEETGNRALFVASLEMYLSGWEWSDPPDPYPGINAASMLLLDGEPARSAEIARKILDGANKSTTDFWTLATIAEAYLLVGEPDNALRFYRKMIAAGPERYENVASARRTVKRNLELLKIPAERFEKLLELPTVAAFVGHDIDAPDRAIPRFPREQEADVQRRLAAALRELGVMYGVSSASAGSDILFLEAMKIRNGFMRVILPCERGRFMREFLDKEWQGRFEAAMDHPRAEVVELDEGDPEELWPNLRPKLWQFSSKLAGQLHDSPVLLAVWDGNAGFIGDTIKDWQHRGAPVKHLPLQAKAAEG